jgi:hypothetical protein
MDLNPEHTITPDSEPPRKNYATPRLLVYGDIRDLTKAVGNKSATADGGMGSTDKTA